MLGLQIVNANLDEKNVIEIKIMVITVIFETAAQSWRWNMYVCKIYISSSRIIYIAFSFLPGKRHIYCRNGKEIQTFGCLRMQLTKQDYFCIV
jgi:hypothetical protein